MAKSVFWTIAAFWVFWSSAAPAASLTELRAAIEGVYVLEEWHSGGKVLRPPQVEGRFVLVNGAAITILLNDGQDSNRTSAALFGKYILDETSFSYGYDTNSSFTQTPAAITASRTRPWEGMRRFAVSIEGKAAHLNSGQQELVFTPEGLSYYVDGSLLRVWRREKAN